MIKRIKQLAIVAFIGLLSLILSSLINKQISFNDFFIFFSGGLIGLIIGARDQKSEKRKI